MRLGLALNLSVFQFEIIGDTAKACEIARAALEDAADDEGADED